MVTVFLAGMTGYKLKAITGKLPQQQLIDLQGIELPGKNPRRKRSPFHMESMVSSLLPLTALTHLG